MASAALMRAAVRRTRDVMRCGPAAAALLNVHPDHPGRSSRSFHHGRAVIVNKRGADLLHDPWFNKHTAFEAPERDRLGLRGLLPPGYQTMEEQMQQFMRQYDSIDRKPRSADDPVDLQKWRILNRLHDRNETLYYRILMDNIQEMSRIVYTPTVGTVCQRYASLFRRPRGMYFSANDQGEMASMVHNWPSDRVDIIVITDGSRVLGVGDCGVQAVSVPVGKLDMYVAAAGINPNRVLPVVFDVGTNNSELMKDPLYLGLRHPRIDGEDYLELIDEFMEAVTTRWPKVIIQFEDMERKWAHVLMDCYRHQYCTFNDDIQGTGGLAVAALTNVLRAQELPPSELANTKIVVTGAGSAVQGMLVALQKAMVAHLGESKHNYVEAARNFWIVDNKGLMTEARSAAPNLLRGFLRPAAEARGEGALQEGAPLAQVVKAVKPDVLFGLSGKHHLFDKEVLRAVKNSGVARPAIFPLSCPTSHSECTAQQAFEGVGPNALFLAGVNYPSVRFPDGKIGHSTQGNHIFLFPGIAAGTLLSGARLVSEGMIHAAANEVAHYISDDDVKKGILFPPLSSIRDITSHVAVAVARKAAEEGLADGIPSLHADQLLTLSKDALRKQVEKRMWVPMYSTLIYGADLAK
ncbi:hypothetical protein CLOM_g2999 [Closterium sp. NIES-68]|nr:hypothetical protein CLOM_g2999 [Closterium sp. NIES-68]